MNGLMGKGTCPVTAVTMLIKATNRLEANDHDYSTCKPCIIVGITFVKQESDLLTNHLVCFFTKIPRQEDIN